MVVSANNLRQDLQFKKARFLTYFLELCIIGEAAKQAGVSRQTIYNWQKEDEQFKADFEDARQSIIEKLEKEAFRRACTGVSKPVFQGGELVGHIQEYSDTLLIFLLKGNAPQKYREHMEITGKDGEPFAVAFEAKGKLLSLINRLVSSTGADEGDKQP